MSTECSVCGAVLGVGASSCSRCDGGTERVRAYKNWFVFAIASVVLLWFSSLAVRSLLDAGGRPYRVVGSFWASGWAATHHLDPYGFYPLTWHFHLYGGDRGPLIYDVNLNPPCMLPLFQLFGRLGLRQMVAGWTIFSVLAIVAGAALVLWGLRGRMQKRQVLWLLLSQAGLMTLWFGQNYSALFLLTCVVWYLLRVGRMDAAAVCIGVMVAMKPNLGFWPVMLWIAGYRRPAILSGATAAALSVLPVVLYGPSIYGQWLHAHSLVSHYLFAADVSLAGFCTRIGSRAAGEVLAVVVALALLIFVYRRRPSQVDVGGIAICAGLLCSPLAWMEYTLIVVPLFAGSRKWGRLETWAVVLLYF